MIDVLGPRQPASQIISCNSCTSTHSKMIASSVVDKCPLGAAGSPTSSFSGWTSDFLQVEHFA